MQNTLYTLWKRESLVDCTLTSAEGKLLKAHKVILSACSAYFEAILEEQYDKHPIFIFKDITYQQLRTILDYMYCGVVNVSEEELPSLISVSTLLQVRGFVSTFSAAPTERVPNVQLSRTLTPERGIQKNSKPKGRKRHHNLSKYVAKSHTSDKAALSESNESLYCQPNVVQTQDESIMDFDFNFTESVTQATHFEELNRSAAAQTTLEQNCLQTQEVIEPKIEIIENDTQELPVSKVDTNTDSKIFSGDSSYNGGLEEERYLPFVQQQMTTKSADLVACRRGCGTFFNSKMAMSSHVYLDCGAEKRFKCSVCQRGFKRKFKLRRHFNSVHKNK